PPTTKYDVFLSFRGEDTRHNFASYLYEALCKANIQTFMDHKLHKGEDISPVLLRTIEESEISVIIFSTDYASSTWCLDELVYILECKKKFGRIVMPIFYKIDPSNVCKQSGRFGDGFAKLKQRFKDNPNKLRKWKNALIQSTSLARWDSKNFRPEIKLVKKIVKDILSKLNYCTSSSCHLEGLVGINHQIEKIEELLIDARIVGIWGMGGIGKTTLAKAVFHNLKAQFEASSFVGNVREQLARIGLNKLMEESLKELLKDEGLHIYNMKSTFVKRRLQQKKILLILDDVDNLLTAEDLTKLCDWFGEGSRIVVTSRDMHVLKNASASATYHVQKLEFGHALNLFSLKAFKQNDPFKSYFELSKLVVDYCQGNPLALVVLGCFLYNRTKQQWESALEKLKQAPHKDIFTVLKLSFDGLDEKQKNVFLDLVHLSSETSYKISLNFIRGFYDFSVYIEISVLKERSLISMDQFGGIEMHDLVREMGQEICRQQLIIDPERPIRLWKHNDIYHLFINKKGSGTIRCISLDMCKTKEMTLQANTFRKMNALKFLKFYKSDFKKPSKVYVYEGLDNLPEELRFFFWEDYPLPSVPLSFCAENLMELEMPHNELQQLWDADQHFPNLGVMNLTASKDLAELPNLSQAPNMSMVYLDECVNLTQIYSSSSLSKLSHLSIRDCKDLRHISIGGNIKETSSGLVAVYNFLDLGNSLFHKLIVKLFVSNDGNIFSGFRVKLVSVSLSEILSTDQYMNNTESSKLKLSSLLPFVTSLRWLDLMEFGNFSERFNFLSEHEELKNIHAKDVVNELRAMVRKPLEVEEKRITEEVITDYTSYYHGKRKPLEIEEEIMTEIMECCCSTSNNRLIRAPNSITRWPLLTQVTLQKSEITGCEVWDNPGISMLKSLAESCCCSRIKPVIDIRISLDKEATIWGGNNDIVAETKWDMPNFSIDIWQELAGDFFVHFPIRLDHESISFLLWFSRSSSSR
ncbi:disease resistance-like protein DSC1, partial [Neltuma alba]|uniref:disease resistance-like protein DSC1 n=2 Tax=Neltuma alba TaxID=207710 RepID=UPI0010A30D03